jgi:murein hydrolase activator
VEAWPESGVRADRGLALSSVRALGLALGLALPPSGSALAEQSGPEAGPVGSMTRGQSGPDAGPLGSTTRGRDPRSRQRADVRALRAPPPARDPEPAIRDALARQLDDEAQAVERAISAAGDKLAAAQLTRTQRLRAAYRVVQAAPGDDAMATARARAAARLLVDRDGGERAVFADEVARLHAARDRIAGEARQLPAVALPGELVRPARGKIARSFGTLEHERSKATLSRRGIDIEVEDGSPVVAPAAGIVRYAGAIRGLDQGVIIDCGTYVTVLAKLGAIALPVGAPIAAGDRIGRAARYRVYLEVRVKLGPGGLPIDPEPLLVNLGR